MAADVRQKAGKKISGFIFCPFKFGCGSAKAERWPDEERDDGSLDDPNGGDGCNGPLWPAAPGNHENCA